MRTQARKGHWEAAERITYLETDHVLPLHPFRHEGKADGTRSPLLLALAADLAVLVRELRHRGHGGLARTLLDHFVPLHPQLGASPRL